MTTTKIDRLAVSTKAPLETVYGAYSDFFGVIGTVVLHHRKKGALRFDNAADVTVDGAQVAMFAWGGQHQGGRLYVDVSGQGCTMAGNRVDDLAIVSADLPDARLRRVDIAADVSDGSVTYESTVRAWEDGKFKTSGRPPGLEKIEHGEDWKGRTAYVGNRDSGKFFRGYEKGKQLAQELRMGIKEGEDLCPLQFLEYVVNGHLLRDWFRAELELKAHTDKSLDWNIVVDRDAYFTGAYPYLQEIFPSVRPEFLLRPQKMGALLVDASLANIRRQYGSTIFTALHHHGGDVSAVWEAICGDKHNERLVRSGALVGL